MSGRRDKRRRKKKKREKRGRLPPGPSVQTMCLRTGARYVMPLTGRYRSLSEAQLELRIAELERVWEELTDSPSLADDRSPLHLRAEYLEAIIGFEIDPPCGCKDHLDAAASGEA